MVVDEGKSVFFTGAAGTRFVRPAYFPDLAPLLWLGTGKSLLLRVIIAALKAKYAAKPAVVAVTASTGMAASNIGGTLFSPLKPVGTLRSGNSHHP